MPLVCQSKSGVNSGKYVGRRIDGERQSSNKQPSYADSFIVGFTTIPRLPNLISQILIKEKGFDVDFGEHGLRMACSSGIFSLYLWAKAAEIGLHVRSGLNSTIDVVSIGKECDLAKAKGEI